MVKSPHVRVVGLLLGLIAVLGYFAVYSASGTTHIAGMWPIGLASGLLVYVTRPMLLRAAGAVFALAFLTIALAGYPAEVAAGYAVSIVIEGLVTQHVLGLRWGDRRRLDDDIDMGRYTVAAVLGAATGAAAVHDHLGGRRIRQPVGGRPRDVRHPPGLAADPAGLLHAGGPSPGRQRQPRARDPLGPDGGWRPCSRSCPRTCLLPCSSSCRCSAGRPCAPPRAKPCGSC